VLSVGPGWDWTTMIGLYPNLEVYTAQQRTLEQYCADHTTSATSRFVLAYHYLTQGHIEAAVKELKQVVALNPGDTLSPKLLRQLDPPTTQAVASVPDDTSPPAGATVAGNWTASPAPDTSISLAIQPTGEFAWEVNRKGKIQRFAGTSTYGSGILTLAQEKGPALVGRIGWTDPNHFTFRIVGDGPEDPGLRFSKP
jgi:hypothetical protein